MDDLLGRVVVRNHTWLITRYWFMRDVDGLFTPAQERKIEKLGADPEWERVVRKMLAKVRGERMAARRAHFNGLPAFVQSPGWDEWRAVVTTPERVAIVVDNGYLLAFEALHPGSWEAPRRQQRPEFGPLVRVDRRGRIVGILNPVYANPGYVGDSGV